MRVDPYGQASFAHCAAPGGCDSRGGAVDVALREYRRGPRHSAQGTARSLTQDDGRGGHAGRFFFFCRGRRAGGFDEPVHYPSAGPGRKRSVTFHRRMTAWAGGVRREWRSHRSGRGSVPGEGGISSRTAPPSRRCGRWARTEGQEVKVYNSTVKQVSNLSRGRACYRAGFRALFGWVQRQRAQRLDEIAAAGAPHERTIFPPVPCGGRGPTTATFPESDRRRPRGGHDPATPSALKTGRRATVRRPGR